jgi:hypothetical protein
MNAIPYPAICRWEHLCQLKQQVMKDHLIGVKRPFASQLRSLPSVANMEEMNPWSLLARFHPGKCRSAKLRNCLVLFLLFALAGTVRGQLAMNASPGSLPPAAYAELVSNIGSNGFTPLYLDVTPIVAQAHAGAEVLVFDLTIGPNTYPIKAERQESLLPPDFKTTVFKDGGKSEVISGPMMFEIYRGSLADASATPVSMAVSNVGITLTIDFPGQPMMLVPSFLPLMKAAVPNQYIWMASIQSPTPGTCQSGLEPIGLQPICPQAQTNYNNTVTLGPCSRTLEIAADADASFMALFPDNPIGNFSAAFGILYSLEAAERILVQEFNITIDVTNIRLFRDPDANPYPTGDLMVFGGAFPEELIESVPDVYSTIPQSQIRRDLPILYTGNNCLPSDPNDFGYFGGYAMLNSVCRGRPGAWVTECVFRSSAWQRDVPHEICHTLGAVHPNPYERCEGPCGLGLGENSFMCIMCLPGNPLFLDQPNVGNMNDYMNEYGGCLQRSAQIVGPELLCPGQTGEYVLETNVYANSPAWSVSNGLTILGPGSVYPSVLVRADNGFFGVPTIQVEVDESGLGEDCDPTYLRRIAVGPPPALCPGETYQVCPGTFDGLYLRTIVGSSLDNFTCTGSNCSNISWNTLGTGNSVLFSVGWANPGIYTFSYDATNSCGTQTHSFIINVLSPSECNPGAKAKTAMIGELAELDLHVAPNPNNGRFRLSYQLPMRSRPVISLLNAQGQTVYELPQNGWLDSGEYQAELSLFDLPSGIYQVNLRTETGQRTVRMVLSK